MIDLFLQLPRALNPQKLESDVLLRNSEAYIFNYYGHDPTVDYTQGWLGYFLSCFGVYGLLASMAVLGLLFSVFDRWLVTTSSALCVPLYYIAVFNIIYYEGTFPFFLGSIRTLAPILAAMVVIHYLGRNMGLLRIKTA